MDETIQDQPRGQGLIEYGMILILVAILIIVVIVALGNSVADMYSTIVNNF